MRWFPNLVLASEQFRNCTSLIEVTYPPKMTACTYAFSGCNNLHKIYLNNITSIGYAAIRVKASNCILYCPATFTNFANYWNYDNAKFKIILPSETVIANNPGSGATAVYVPDESVAAYKTAWSSIASKIYPLSAFVE